MAMAVNNPRVQVVIADDPSSDESATRPGGAFSLLTLQWWHILQYGLAPAAADLAAAGSLLAIEDADEQLLGTDDPYWNLVASHDDIAPWPAEGALQTTAEGACVPALVVYSQTSWWRDPVSAFEAWSERGCPERRDDVRLILTPDDHTHHLASLGIETTPVNQQMLDMIDHFLGDRRVPALTGQPRVSYYASPGSDFGVLASWPPLDQRAFYLTATGALAAAPADGGSPLSASLDPAAMDPCRDGDYPAATYDSAPLEAALVIAGEPRLELDLDIDGVDADVFAHLSEVRAGAETYVQLGAARARYRGHMAPTDLVPGQPVAVPVVFYPVAHRFRRGSVIRLRITFADCYFFENPLTGEPSGAQTHTARAEVTIPASPARPSQLILPVAAP